MIRFLITGLVRDRTRSLFPAATVIAGVTLTVFLQTYLKGIMETTSDEVVSTDFVHSSVSSIYDEGSGIELNKRFFKLVAWYDNEWGYSCRVAGLLKYVIDRGL